MRKRALLFALALSTGLASTAYAGTWFKDEGRWAYQQDDGTQIKEGWFTDTDGRAYNFTGGVVRTGFYKEGDSWYYFDQTSGERKSGWVQDDNKWYFMNPAGVMQTGWITVNGNWYYCKGDGHAITDRVEDINGNKYYFHPDGHLAKNEWVLDNTYHADANGMLDMSTWVDGVYVNGTGKVQDSESKSSTKEEKIDNKVFTLEEYKKYAEDAYDRYVDKRNELFDYINEYRMEWNEKNVYNYSGEDDDYIEEHELQELDQVDALDYAACLRAAELASQQRASGARPDGRNWDTVLTDYGVSATTVVESVAFGINDAEDVYDELKSGSGHSSYWQRKQYTKLGVGCAYDTDGKAFWVLLYVE